MNVKLQECTLWIWTILVKRELKYKALKVPVSLHFYFHTQSQDLGDRPNIELTDTDWMRLGFSAGELASAYVMEVLLRIQSYSASDWLTLIILPISLLHIPKPNQSKQRRQPIRGRVLQVLQRKAAGPLVMCDGVIISLIH